MSQRLEKMKGGVKETEIGTGIMAMIGKIIMIEENIEIREKREDGTVLKTAQLDYSGFKKNCRENYKSKMMKKKLWERKGILNM